MRVALADVRADVLKQAAARLGEAAVPQLLDVTDRGAWAANVQSIEQQLGGIDLLCSNAGVNLFVPTQEATYEDWDFVLGVNLKGAINAVHTVVPRMIAAGRPGHVVLTSSVNGLFTGPGAGVYATSKYALVGLAESLRADLKPHGIGVSVLCPGPVKSELFESTAAVRPPHLARTASQPVVPPGVQREDTPIFRTAPTGEEIGRKVLEGVRSNNLYILTHPEMQAAIRTRFHDILEGRPPSPAIIA